MEGDFMYTTMEQPIDSPSEKLQPELSYICSIIRFTRTDSVDGTAQECDQTLQYRIELLAPSAGLSTSCLAALQSYLAFDQFGQIFSAPPLFSFLFPANRRCPRLGIRTYLPVVFVPENYETIGSCVLSINAVKTGACEISAITVLIWDRVLQLAIVGLLIGYARDMAAGMGYHHLLVRRVEGVVEGILRVIGWETCACKGFGGDGAAGLCAEPWTTVQVFGGGEDGQTQDNGQPDDSGQTEGMDGAGESGRGTGVVNIEEDELTYDQIRRKITLDELIETAAKEKWDLVMNARAEKRSFDALEPGEADDNFTSKRPKIEFNSRCNNRLGCADRRQEQVLHKPAIKAGSSPSKSSSLSPVPEKPTSKLQKAPPPPVIRASSLTINALSSATNGGRYHHVRGTRGRGDPRNAKMIAARRREAQAKSRSTSFEISTASKQLLLLQEMANSEKPPQEPIERSSSVPKFLWQRPPDPTGSSMLVAPRRAPSVPTASKNPGFFPTALDSGDSIGHGYGMLDDSEGALQTPEENTYSRRSHPRRQSSTKK